MQIRTGRQEERKAGRGNKEEGEKTVGQTALLECSFD
jgi:hypothetical protein